MRVRRIAAATVVAALAFGGCAAGTTTTPAPLPTAAATGTATPDTTTPSPDSTPSRSDPKPIFTERSTRQLRTALMRTEDLPTGYAEAAETNGDTIEITSTDDTCRALVTLLRAEEPERALAQATVSFEKGDDAGVDESLVSMGTTGRASELIEEVGNATRGCAGVTLTMKGSESSTLTVSTISSVDQVGDDSITLQFEATQGAFAGLTIIQVYAHRRDVALGLNAVGIPAADAQQIATDAIARATDELQLDKKN